MSAQPEPEPAPQATETRHQWAVRRTLGFADDAAAREDWHDALAWIRTLEALGHQFTSEHLAKHTRWQQALAAARQTD